MRNLHFIFAIVFSAGFSVAIPAAPETSRNVSPSGRSPIGAVATVRYVGGGQMTVPFVTGDSSAAEHSYLKHFGLGRQSRVEALEVRWLDGKEKRIPNPAINKYYDILYSETESTSDSRTRHKRIPRSALAKRGLDRSGGGIGL